MVLGSSELKSLHNITALNAYNIRGSSVDLSLNDRAYIKKDDRLIDLFIEDIDQVCLDMYKEIDLACGYELKPREYMYSSSVEKVSIPVDMCGIVLPRSSFSRLGLILPISSYANPGYSGNLPIVIYNASNSIIKIPPYIRIMQLVLCEIKGEAIPYDSHKDSKYQGEISPTPPKFNDEEIGEILAKLKNR